MLIRKSGPTALALFVLEVICCLSFVFVVLVVSLYACFVVINLCLRVPLVDFFDEFKQSKWVHIHSGYSSSFFFSRVLDLLCVYSLDLDSWNLLSVACRISFVVYCYPYCYLCLNKRLNSNSTPREYFSMNIDRFANTNVFL